VFVEQKLHLILEKYVIVVLFNSENGTKTDFNIPKMTLTTILKNKDEMVSNFFLSECTRNT